MIEISELPKSDIVEIHVDSEVSRVDFREALKQLEEIFEKRDRVRVLEEVEQVPAFDPSMIWDDLKFSLKHMEKVTHCAVLSDLGWVGPYARIVGALSRCQVRVFPATKRNTALNWLRDAR